MPSLNTESVPRGYIIVGDVDDFLVTPLSLEIQGEIYPISMEHKLICRGVHIEKDFECIIHKENGTTESATVSVMEVF
eukprot:CFRG5694T1